MTPERYVFDGAYREFRGYVFANRKPVTITDAATLEAVKHDYSFRKVEDEKVQETQAAAPVLEREPAMSYDACPKCGRVVKQGKYLHVKHCKG